MSSMTLKQALDESFTNTTFDKAFCQRVIRYSQQFMTRNDDHSAFFGGVLMGVNPIRFMDSDREQWYEEVLDIDEGLYEQAFRKVRSINHTYNVMGDPFNFTPVYIVHRLQKATNLPKQLRQDAQMHAFMVLHYRFLTSLLIPRFRYPAQAEIARAAYASLSGRFDLRRYGSWRLLLEARSLDLLRADSIYARTIRDFEPDKMLIRTVTDTQGRIREVVKTIYKVYLDTKESGHRIRSTSMMTVSTDGEMILKDSKNEYRGYLRYIKEIVGSERSFIRDELIEVITSTMRTMPPELLQESLLYLSRNYKQPKHQYLDELLDETLLYIFDYLQKNRNLLRHSNDLPGLLDKLKKLLTASRSSDPAVLKLRNNAEQLVNQSVRTRNSSVVASVRTGVLLYIALRSLTKQYYTQ